MHRDDHRLSARELLDALNGGERSPSEPPRTPLQAAAGKARLYLRVHRTQIQREIARVDRSLGRVGIPSADVRVHKTHRALGRYHVPTGRVSLWGAADGAPRPEAGVGFTLAANAPPDEF